ncbi:helix-turn-helix domain-containing protein [Nanoarchaeota archaeon]
MAEDLEKALKEKIEPYLEETMQKFLGIKVDELEKDITDKIERKLIGYIIHTELSFKLAKNLFKKEFIKRLIQTHQGNVSEVAKLIGLDRRSIHRDIKKLDIDIRKLREKMYRVGYFKKEAMDSAIRKTLDTYKSILHPGKLKKFYEEVPLISENIVRFLPKKILSWKEAEEEFEKLYLSKVLEENKWNLSQTAKKIDLRYETLIRKIKKLKLKSTS